jgi:hypothetical protein
MVYTVVAKRENGQSADPGSLYSSYTKMLFKTEQVEQFLNSFCLGSEQFPVAYL